MRAIQAHVNTVETLMRFAPLVLTVNANGATDVVNSEAKIFENRIMSTVGHKQTSPVHRATSALPPKADKLQTSRFVRFVQKRTYALQQNDNLLDHLVGDCRPGGADRRRRGDTGAPRATHRET